MSNLILHDYLRDTVVSTYKECIYCKSRTQFTRVTCGYCYSCHWKREELGRVQLEIAKNVNLRKDSHAATIIIEQPASPSHQRPRQQTKVIVYGRETEPICSYRKCHHKSSVHGHDNHNCKCRHAMNYATGISILPLTKIEVL